MSYHDINETAKEIASLLESLNDESGKRLIPNVRTACAGSYEQILKLIGDITMLPAAIVCIGPGEYNDSLSRTLRPGIVLIDKLSLKPSQSAQSLLTILQRVLALFEQESPRDGVTIEGCLYTLDDFAPLALSSIHSAYLVTLNVTQPINF